MCASLKLSSMRYDVEMQSPKIAQFGAASRHLVCLPTATQQEPPHRRRTRHDTSYVQVPEVRRSACHFIVLNLTREGVYDLFVSVY